MKSDLVSFFVRSTLPLSAVYPARSTMIFAEPPPTRAAAVRSASRSATQLSCVRLGPPEHISRSPLKGWHPTLGRAILRPMATARFRTDSHNSEGSRHFIGTRPGTL
jgi:hypothetical protein